MPRFNKPKEPTMTTFESLQRVDIWSHGHDHSQVRYRLVADAAPDLLCRVLNLFAMQYLVPNRMLARQKGGRLYIDLHVGSLTLHRARVIGEKMRNLVDVAKVELSIALQAEAMPGTSEAAISPGNRRNGQREERLIG
jgi:hypothetical protein